MAYGYMSFKIAEIWQPEMERMRRMDKASYIPFCISFLINIHLCRYDISFKLPWIQLRCRDRLGIYSFINGHFCKLFAPESKEEKA